MLQQAARIAFAPITVARVRKSCSLTERARRHMHTYACVLPWRAMAFCLTHVLCTRGQNDATLAIPAACRHHDMVHPLQHMWPQLTLRTFRHDLSTHPEASADLDRASRFSSALSHVHTPLLLTHQTVSSASATAGPSLELQHCRHVPMMRSRHQQPQMQHRLHAIDCTAIRQCYKDKREQSGTPPHVTTQTDGNCHHAVTSCTDSRPGMLDTALANLLCVGELVACNHHCLSGTQQAAAGTCAYVSLSSAEILPLVLDRVSTVSPMQV